jgi:hypothetical protein
MRQLFSAFVTGTFVALALSGVAKADSASAPSAANEAYSYTLSPGGSVSLDDARGSIDVVAWDKNVVQIEADKCADNGADLDATRIEISTKSDEVNINTVFPQSSGNVFSWLTHLGHSKGCSAPEVDYVVHLPHDARVTLRSASADIDVSGPLVQISAQSASGALSIKDVSTASVSSDSGDVSLEQAHGSLAVSTQSGSIVVNNASGDIVAKSESGDIGLYEFAGKSVVTTMSGDITLRSFTGVTRIVSMSGDVSMTIVHGKGMTVSAQTTSGDIYSDLPQQAHAPIEIHTVSGDISVRSI